MGKNFFSKMLKPIKSAGKWGKHAAEDVFHYGEKTIGKGVNKVFNFADKQLGRAENVLTNPTMLIIVGAVVVAIIILK